MRAEGGDRFGDREGLFAASDALYRALVEQVPCIVYVDSHEAEPRSLYVSPQVESILGYMPYEYLADAFLWQKTIDPKDSARVARAWASAVESETAFELEYRMVRPDGTRIWILDGAVPVLGPDGSPMFWQGVMFDITASKRAEQDLRESEARYRALIDNVPAVVYVVAPDDDRKTLYVSSQVERSLGYAREEWLAQPDIWMELLHPDDREQTLAAHDSHNESGQPWDREYRLIASDGRAVWFRDVATLVRDRSGWPRYWQGIQMDITELKRAEEALRAARDEMELRVIERTAELEEANEMMSLEIAERKRAEADLRVAEARYRLLVEQTPAVTYVWDVSSRVQRDPAVYVSPQIEELLGYTPEEWNADADFWKTRLHPDDRAEVLAETMRSEVTGAPFSMEYRILAKTGHVVWVLDEVSLVSRDEHGVPKLFQGVLIDISKRKEAEAEAAAHESRFRILAEQIPAITYVWDMRRGEQGAARLTYVSPQIERILGYTPEDWIGEPSFWLRNVHPDDRPRVLEETLRVEETGEPWSIEYRFVASDGRHVWVHDEGRVLTRDVTGRPETFQGLAVDITERVRAHEDVRDAEERYRELVERIPAITYLQEIEPNGNGEGRYVFISPQCRTILGYEPEELLAERDLLQMLVHPDDRERALGAAAHSARTGEPFNSEFRVTAKDGRVVWLHSEAVLAHDADGGPRFWHGVALDITARKLAEQSIVDLTRVDDAAAANPRSRGPQPTR